MDLCHGFRLAIATFHGREYVSSWQVDLFFVFYTKSGAHIRKIVIISLRLPGIRFGQMRNQIAWISCMVSIRPHDWIERRLLHGFERFVPDYVEISESVNQRIYIRRCIYTGNIKTQLRQ